ncbi:hypothetical protein N9M41_04015 [Rhodopirellula sp.]|jgi:hypothetical protein|nr:hypothetical protein [Rhodopirellula sp.]
MNVLNSTCFGLILGLLMGMTVAKADGAGVLFVCGIGGFLGFASACMLSVLDRFVPVHPKTTDRPALYGAGVGTAVGAVVGPKANLGRYMIEALNPSLPEMDFGFPLGVLAGILIGSFFGAITFSLAAKLRRLSK